MTEIHQLPSDEKRHDEASLWIARLERGLSTPESESLKNWIAQDKENEVVLLEMAKLWDKMDTLSRLSALFPRPIQQHRPRVRLTFATAACAIFVIFLSTIAVQKYPAFLTDNADYVADSEELFETAVGESSRVTLSDGSEITLNTDSKLRVRYTNNHRTLLLERGEINVAVAKDPLRPLSVLAAGNIVQAVGTEFNIEITDDQHIELLVTEGKVRVGLQTKTVKLDKILIPEPLPSDSVLVSSGETIVLGSLDEEVSTISESDIKVKLSWKKGNLIFRGEPLENAIEEVGRYTSVEFVIVDEELKKVRVSGFFRSGDVDGLLKALRDNFNIVNKRVDNQKVVLYRE